MASLASHLLRLQKDAAYSFRTLGRSKGFVLLVTLTLALGIGANTAVFSLLNVVLLRPLPYPHADRVVTVYESKTPGDAENGSALAPANFIDMREQNRSFSAIGGFVGLHYILLSGGPPVHVWGGAVSAGWWDVFGVNPERGRTFTAQEDRPNAPQVAVLTDHLWRDRFNADPQIVGKNILLNGDSFEVVGVMPPDKTGFHPEIDFWTPLERQILPERMRWRDSRFIWTVARLKPGVTRAQAAADANRIMGTLDRQYAGSDVLGAAALEDFRKDLVGDTGREVFIAFGVVGLVLLVACANIANLMLVRAGRREREFAVRIALGARASDLLRQLTVESLLLSFAGAMVALPVGYICLRLLSSVADWHSTLVHSAEINTSVTAFSFLLAAVSGIAFGLAPALSVLGCNTEEVLRRSGHAVTSTRGGHRVRDGIAIAEIACSVVLLAGAGLLVRSMMALRSVPLGFAVQERSHALITLPRMKYAQDKDVVRFYSSVVERIRSAPGVLDAGVMNVPPLGDRSFEHSFALSTPGSAADYHAAALRLIDGHSLSMLGIAVRGRAFTDQDTIDSEPVCIINQTMAREYWRSQDAIGKTLTVIRRDTAGFEKPRRIVGIAADVRDSISLAPPPTIYVPYQQIPFPSMHIVIQSSLQAGALMPIIKNAVQQVDPDQPVVYVEPLQTMIDDALWPWQAALRLLGGLALVALVLSAIGLFGLMASLIRERTNEFGIRMAVGASPHKIRNFVLRRASVNAAFGIAVGSLAFLGTAKSLGPLIFGIRAADPVTLGAVACFVACASLLATYVPARRAMQIAPMQALRVE